MVASKTEKGNESIQ